jgi:hypothetical protein
MSRGIGSAGALCLREKRRICQLSCGCDVEVGLIAGAARISAPLLIKLDCAHHLVWCGESTNRGEFGDANSSRLSG